MESNPIESRAIPWYSRNHGRRRYSDKGAKDPPETRQVSYRPAAFPDEDRPDAADKRAGTWRSRARGPKRTGRRVVLSGSTARLSFRGTG